MLHALTGLTALVLTALVAWWAAGEARSARAALRIGVSALLNGVGVAIASVLFVPAFAVMIGGTMLAIIAYRERRVSRFARLLARLAANEAGAVAALFDWLDDARPEPPDPHQVTVWARYVCAAAEGLLTEDHIDEAERALRLLPASIDDARTSATRAQYLAVIHIRRGELAHARAVLSCAPRHIPDPLMARGVAATNALLLALEGAADGALGRVEELREAGPLHPAVERLLIAASAHALASGNPDAATRLLESATNEHGLRLLERIRRDDGPASAIANAMLQEHIGPYR